MGLLYHRCAGLFGKLCESMVSRQLIKVKESIILKVTYRVRNTPKMMTKEMIAALWTNWDTGNLLSPVHLQGELLITHRETEREPAKIDPFLVTSGGSHFRKLTLV